MKTHTIKTYSFNELSEEAKQKALRDNYDWEVQDGWWRQLYDQLSYQGITVKAFDIYRGAYAHVEIDQDKMFKAQDELPKSLAKAWEKFKARLKEDGLLKAWEDGGIFETQDEEDDFEAATQELEENIGEEVLDLLREDYNYLTSDECLAESFELNDLEFLKDGKRYLL